MTLKNLHLRKLNWLECGTFRLHNISIFEVSEAFVSGCFSDSAGTRQFADLDLRTCRRESKWLNTFSSISLYSDLDTFLQLTGTKVTTSNTFWLVYDPSKFPWVYFFNYFNFKWRCSIIKPMSHTHTHTLSSPVMSLQMSSTPPVWSWCQCVTMISWMPVLNCFSTFFRLLTYSGTAGSPVSISTRLEYDHTLQTMCTLKALNAASCIHVQQFC